MCLLPLLALLGGCPPIELKGAPDADGDGFADVVDCDDAQSTVHAGAEEVCDGLDNDCNGAVDDDPINLRTFYSDADGDSHGDPARPVAACGAPAGTMVSGDDCDDARSDVHPGAVETCDGADQDCDGAVDEDAADAVPWYLDGDGDGYGDAATATVGCTGAVGDVRDGSDCDDTDAAVHPDAVETDCTDPVDYNCDGSAAREDADADGRAACEDCDDADPAVTTPLPWYADADGDGWGDPVETAAACAQPTGYTGAAGDCDDTDALRNPGAVEVCDDVDRDEDCSGTADDADVGVDPASRTRYGGDGDGDGYGDPATSLERCDGVVGYVANVEDCDDTRAWVSPAGAEICDGADLDEDCDGAPDDADPSATGQTPWYADADADAYGAGTPTWTCAAPPGTVPVDGDCDDAAPTVNPAAAEACDGVDDDCDGVVDDGVTTVWYIDADGDGWGDPAVSAEACAEPVGYVDNDGDCDDADPLVYPDGKAFCAPASEDADSAAPEDTPEDSAATSDSGDTASASAVRFLVVGDTGDGSAGQYSVAAGMATVCAAEGCDFVLLVGDNFYPGGVTSTADPLWTTAFEDPYAGLGLQFRAVMGNHDWNHTFDTTYLDAQVDYTAVSPRWSMPAGYYTFTEGDITFYGIDTWLISEGAGADQEAWLPVQRAASTTTWNLVFGHHPYISNGPHGNAEPDLQAFVDANICGQYDVYFCGHDHDLQWLEDTCGTAFLVSGSGHSTYGLGGSNPTYFEAASLGFLWVEIDGNSFTGVFYDEDGVELYRGTITR